MAKKTRILVASLLSLLLASCGSFVQPPKPIGANATPNRVVTIVSSTGANIGTGNASSLSAMPNEVVQVVNSSNQVLDTIGGSGSGCTTSGTSILKGNGSGGCTNAVSGTDYAPATSGSSVLLGNGAGGFSSLAGNTLASHNFANSISAAGVLSGAQPAFTDISGSVASTQMPALTGDTTTSAGSTVTTTGKVNGGSIPASATVIGSNSSSQFVAASLQGNGTKAQLSTGTTTTNDCVKFDANGNTVDAGAACGTSGIPSGGTTTQVFTSNGGSNNGSFQSQPQPYDWSISGMPTASQIWPLQCDYNDTFPANFSGTYPDAIGTVTCGTPPGEFDSYTIKVASVAIGNMNLGNPVQTASGTSAAASFTVATSSNVTAGNTLVIFYEQDTNQTVTFTKSSGSATIGTISTCPASGAVVAAPAGDASVNIGYIPITGSGSLTIQAAIGVADPQGMILAEYQAMVASPLDACGAGSSANTATTVQTGNVPTSGNTSNAQDLILGMLGVHCSACSLSAVTSGYAAISSLAYSTGSLFPYWETVGAVGQFSVSGTVASNDVAGVALALKMNNANCNGATLLTTGGTTQTCNAGQRLELDAPAAVSGSNIAVGISGHTP